MPALQIDKILDIVLVVFHGGLTLFNLLGWIWEKSRRLHLLVSGLTILSWFGLGLFYGWGFCPCTEWHWRVKARLGETGLPYSTVKYYVDKITGISWDPMVVDVTVVSVGLLVFVLSCRLNWRDRMHRR